MEQQVSSDLPYEQIRVLLADDEQNFLKYTAKYLQENKVECDTCSSTTEVLALLEKNRYDVLILDIVMPENSNMEFVEQLSTRGVTSPVIVVTGYPSVETAVHAVNLSVFSYMLKPIEPAELLRQIQAACVRAKLINLVGEAENRLKRWMSDINNIKASISQLRGSGSSVPTDAFLGLTFGNIIGSLADMSHFIDVLLKGSDYKYACSLFNCPRLKEHVDVMRHAIQTLDKTKRSFKSKELGELRKYMEQFLSNGPIVLPPVGAAAKAMSSVDELPAEPDGA